jgi:hypothetical protein
MISEIDLQDWIVCPAEPLHNVQDDGQFMYENKFCRIKKTNWFTFDVVDSNGNEFELDFYAMVNPLKKKES